MAGIEQIVFTDSLPSPVHPGVVRVAVWVALGSASWAALGAALVVLTRFFS